MLRLLNDRKVRNWIAQGATILALLVVFGFFVENARVNLTKGGIATGFGFLDRVSGLDVTVALIPYSSGSTFGRMLLVGILNTLLVSFLSIILATVLGFAIGIARLSSNWLLSTLCGAFIELVRNIPLLLFVFFWYFGVLAALPPPRSGINVADVMLLNNRGVFVPAPTDSGPFVWVAAMLGLGALLSWLVNRWARDRQARTGQSFPTPVVVVGLLVGLPLLAAVVAGRSVGWDMPQLRGFNVRGGTALIPELVALLGALVTYTAGFIAEVVRAGIQSVSDGQRQAASALGLNRAQVLRLVVLPQAMRVIIPPLTNQYLNIVKNSSFAAAIAFPDIVSLFVGSTLNATGQAIEIIAMTLGIYLAISLAVSAFMNWYNARIALVTR